jgi:hypothetical protein
MTFSENRFPLFGIMLKGAARRHGIARPLARRGHARKFSVN